MEREMRGWFKMEGTYVYLWLIHAKVRHAVAAAKSLQSCPTLCDPIDGSPPGSPSPGFSRQEHWSVLPSPSPMLDINQHNSVKQPSFNQIIKFF